MIKAIETMYKGYRMRSRLEARWAIVWESLGLPWTYEHEGYECKDGTLYLPDFFLPTLNLVVEIKPMTNPPSTMPWLVEGTKEYSFVETIMDDDGPGRSFPHGFIVLFGKPGVPDPYSVSSPYVGTIPGDSPYFLCECEYCGSVGFQFDGRSARNVHTKSCRAMTGDKGYNVDSPRLAAAYDAASSARFEYGETPR